MPRNSGLTPKTLRVFFEVSREQIHRISQLVEQADLGVVLQGPSGFHQTLDTKSYSVVCRYNGVADREELANSIKALLEAEGCHVENGFSF